MRSRRAIYFNVSLLSNHDIDADVLKESDYIFLVLIGNVKWVLIFFFCSGGESYLVCCGEAAEPVFGIFMMCSPKIGFPKGFD